MHSRSEASATGGRRRPGQGLLRVASLLPIIGLLSVPALLGWRAGGPALAAEATRHVVYLPLLSPPIAVMPPPRFSAPAGWVEAPFALTLGSPVSGASIRYTVDGSLPSPDHGSLYLTPLPIQTTQVVRAVAYKTGMQTSGVTTASYLFLDQVLRQSAEPDLDRFPPAWGRYTEGKRGGLPVPADYAMDPKVVDAPATAERILSDLRALPSISLVADSVDLWGSPGLFGDHPGIYANPMEEGADWERPVSVEWIDARGRQALQIDAGLRIAGQWSRKPDSSPKHSFSLRFRKRYGADHLSFPVFPGSPVERFESLRLRAGQADAFTYFPLKALYVHDQVGRDLQLDLGQPAARGRFVHLYVNGLYWGLYNLAEEVTAQFAADHLGGTEGDFDVAKGLEIRQQVRGGEAVINSFEMEDGDEASFRALLALRDAGPPVDAGRLAEAEALLDLDAFAAYHVLEIYAGNDDWLGKNWRALRRRVDPRSEAARAPGGRWTFLVWDIERTAFLRLIDPLCGRADHRCGSPHQRDPADIANTAGVMGLHAWLKDNVDYRLRFADQARRLLMDDGPLTPAPVAQHYRRRLDEIDGAIVGESARWGDVYPLQTYERTFLENSQWWLAFWQTFRHPETEAVQRRDPEWLAERRRLLEQALPPRTAIVIEQLCREQLLSPVPGLALRSESPSGIAAASRITISALPEGCPGRMDGGDIYYTVNGEDPRQEGSGQPGAWWTGRPTAGAARYVRPLRLSGFQRLKARMAVPTDGGLLWGPLGEAVIGTPQVAITEILYAPPKGEAEFLELQNLEAVPVDLSGSHFEGIDLTLPPGTVLLPGAYALVTDSPGDLEARYGPNLPLIGEYHGGLSNDGESIRLLDPLGRLLGEAHYDDGDFWPLAPDGHGFSLVPESRPGAAEPERWRASSLPGGSPGTADPPARTPRVLIDEFLPSSSAPFEDAIELYNPNLGPVDLSGWLLSDNRDELGRFKIPAGTVIAPGGYLVVYEEQLRQGGDGGPGFSLAGRGEGVYLAAADHSGQLIGYASGARYGPAQENLSLGRYQNRDGTLEWVRLNAPTFGVDQPADPTDFRRGTGAPNSPPLVGPLYLAELLLASSPGGPAPYVELANLGDQDQALTEPNDLPWRLEGRLSYSFPAAAAVPARGRLLVVADDPGAFRQAHAIPDAVPVYGPAILAPPGEGPTETLQRPFPAEGPQEPPLFIDLERLTVLQRGSWPAARPGVSLERLEPPRYVGEPDSWTALRPGGTPGRANTVPQRVYLPWSGS